MVEPFVEQTRLAPGGIPSLVVRPPQRPEPLPLIVALHGFGGHKASELPYWRKLCLETNSVVIAPDARLHGTRIPDGQDPLGLYADMFYNSDAARFYDIVEGTGADVRALVTPLLERPDIDATRLGILGVSMGGMVLFDVVSRDPRFTVASAVISTPDFGRRDLNGGRDETLLGPLGRPDAYYPLALQMQNGARDPLMGRDGPCRLYNELMARYTPAPERLEYHEYPDLGHDVTPGMVDRSIGWLKRWLGETGHDVRGTMKAGE